MTDRIFALLMALAMILALAAMLVSEADNDRLRTALGQARRRADRAERALEAHKKRPLGMGDITQEPSQDAA